MGSFGATIAFLSHRRPPQASLGYAPFKLVYRHCPHSLLDLVRGGWETGGGRTEASHYVSALRKRLQSAIQVATSNLEQAQSRQKECYDKNAQEPCFQIGQRVLVLLLTSTSKILTFWQGPYKIVKWADPLFQPGHKKEKQIYHINLFKLW